MIKKAGVTVLAKDRSGIEEWFKKYKSKKDGLASVIMLLDHFELTKRLVNLKQRISAHFSGNYDRALQANKVMAPDCSHTFEELVDFLRRAGLDLRQLNVNLPERSLAKAKTDQTKWRETFADFAQYYECMKERGEVYPEVIFREFDIQRMNIHPN